MVIANLWDVTDKDIDRFSSSLFKSFDEAATTSVPILVHEARKACLMRYLVGSAPVIYGVPITLSK